MQEYMIPLLLVTIASYAGASPSGAGAVEGPKPPQLPPRDLCDVKQAGYLPENEGNCLCACQKECPGKQEMKSCGDNITKLCGPAPGEIPMLPFQMIACAAEAIIDCPHMTGKNFTECDTCVDNCVSPESLQVALDTMKQLFGCMSGCFLSADCEGMNQNSDECNLCQGNCRKAVATKPTSESPPPSPAS